MKASQIQGMGSRFIKAIDLLNADTDEYHEISITIDRCVIEQVGQGGDQKPVLYFTELKKAMTLNKTNLTTLATNLGDETDDWSGQKVTLYVTQEPFNGQVYDVVRVKPRPRRPSGTASVSDTTRARRTLAAPPTPTPAAAEVKGFDPDEIPF